MKPSLHDDPGAFGGHEPTPDYAAARFVVLPLPYDGTSTWLKGAERGPQAIDRGVPLTAPAGGAKLG